MATQDSSSGRTTLVSYSADLLSTPPAATQMSVQCRQSRMHVTMSTRSFSPRSASVSAMQAWMQSFSASRASPRSTESRGDLCPELASHTGDSNCLRQQVAEPHVLLDEEHRRDHGHPGDVHEP